MISVYILMLVLLSKDHQITVTTAVMKDPASCVAAAHYAEEKWNKTHPYDELMAGCIPVSFSSQEASK